MVEFNDTRHCTCRWTRPFQFTAPDILPGDKTTLVDMVKTCEKHSSKKCWKRICSLASYQLWRAKSHSFANVLMKFRDQLKPNGTCSSCHWTKRTKGYKLCSTNYVSTSLCDACLLCLKRISGPSRPSRQDRVNLPGDAWKPHMQFHGNIPLTVGPWEASPLTGHFTRGIVSSRELYIYIYFIYYIYICVPE